MPYWYKHYMLIVGVIGSIAPWIQFIEILINKSTENISLISYIIIFIAMSSWMIYGIFLKDRPIIIANIVGVIGIIACLLSMIWC